MWLCQRLVLAGVTPRTVIQVKAYPSRCCSAPRYCSSVAFCPARHTSLTRLCLRIKLRVARPRSTTAKRVLETSTKTSALVYLIKWGVISLLVAAVTSLTVVWWELCLLRRSMSKVTSTLTGGHPDTISTTTTTTTTSSGGWRRSLFPWWSTKDGQSLDSGVSGMWFPWLRSKSQDVLMVLELCDSKERAVRRLGVRALAARSSWHDYQCRYVAQAADYRTLIGLARSRDADTRFFLPQPSLVTIETPVTEELASLLLELDQQHRDNNNSNNNINGKGQPASSAATTLAYQHLQHKHRATDDKRHFWGFDGSTLDVVSVDDQLPEDKLLLQFVSALAQYCCTAEDAQLFVKRHGLAVMQRVVGQYGNTDTFTAVAALLGNLAMHLDTHEMIVRTGWLGPLKSWCETGNSMLAVTAGRTLANLDRDWTSELLDDGVVILHPLYRSRKTVHADVVFVHGLRGGAVKTWRQQDMVNVSPQHGDEVPRTDCWPKDWLAEDCPHVRILSVHYDTTLSSWSTKERAKDRCTLEGRSQELLEKLQKAGVGQRPIIWVGHSMGGLLIKQMLELSGQGGQRSVRQETCGLLLYSVPHHGLSIAALSSQIHYLIYPSVEVQQLRPDSSHLKKLHSRFVQYVESHNIPCLSFGEKSKTHLGKTLPKLLLVPPQSSDPGVGEFCPLPLNHINICKPDSRDSTLYQKSLTFMHRCIFFSYMHRIRKGVSGTVD